MGEIKHTPGPWECHPDDLAEGLYWVLPEATTVAEDKANARLIAAAPDHALIAAALCAGVARWDRDEFCIGGLRHSTKLDEFGVPVMTDGMRAALAKANGSAA